MLNSKSDVEVNISKFRMNWMQDCGRATWGFETWRYYFMFVKQWNSGTNFIFLQIHGKPTVTKLIFDKHT